MPQSARFWDRIADRYAKRPVADEAAYQEKLDITRGYLRPDMKVLEFGCGTGSTALVHASRVRQIHAIDISARMLDIARTKAEAQGASNVTFECSDIEDYDAPDESFDVVLGLSILHLLEHRENAIAKVHRLLKPGGVFVSSTACIGDMAKLFAFILPVGRVIGVIPYVQVFTKQELEQSIVGAGFDVEHNWQPGKGKAVFLVARKPGCRPS